MPDTRRIGQYRLIETLGTGAMGTVFLAEDGDSLVALKLIHEHLLRRRGFFKRFHREARAGRSVDHPNVVRTLASDLLFVDAVPHCFLVMEYVEGKTLRELVKDLGTVPEALAREIGRQAAAGLEAIHEARIIHRDLKPENILITRDHRVRIMDLGVARVLDATSGLTREGQFAGSLHYASPEQFRRDEVGPRADLYSLGVVLYELCTGENPFRYDDLSVVIRSHLNTIPARASDRSPDVSLFLAEVIAALLEKDASRRIESAETLRELLARGENSPWWVERERAVLREKARVPQVPVQRETSFQGRDEELSALRRAWRRAREGRGHVVLIEGEAGIGKSRLVDAFLGEFGDESARVLYGSYSPSGGPGGLSSGIINHFGWAELTGALRPHLSETPSLVPSFAALLKREAISADVPGITEDGLRSAFCHLMRALAAERPLLWVVEDLHFAAPERRKIILSLARALEGHPVMLLVTTRPGRLQEEMVDLARLANFERIDLPRLGARDVVLLLQGAFRSQALAEKLGVRIALKSDGVPFFIFEMIRGLREGQFVTELPDGTYVETRVIDAIEVPSAVQDLIEVRLNDLDREEREMLDVGSVLGFEFDADLVARALGFPRVAVLQRLADIERRSGVVRSVGRSFRFDHHQIQEVVYGSQPVMLREEYHSLLAEAFAGQEEADDKAPQSLPGETACFLATHRLRGRDPESALPLVGAAMDHLGQAYRNEEAIDLASRALCVGTQLSGSERTDLLLRKAARLSLVGRYEDESADLEEAHQSARATGDRLLLAQVDRAFGQNLFRTGRYVEALAALTRAREAAREAGDCRLEAEVTERRGVVLYLQGKFDEAREEFESSIRLAGRLAARDVEGLATAHLGLVCTRTDAYEESIVHLKRARVLGRATGNRLLEASATGNLGNVFADLGRYPEARKFHLRHLSIAERIGHRAGMGSANLNLGNTYWFQGQYEGARATYGTAEAVFRELGDLDGESKAVGNLGSVLISEGRWKAALAKLLRALELAVERGLRDAELHPAGNLVDVLICLGRQEEAATQLERYLDLAREVGDRWHESHGLRRQADLAAQTGGEASAESQYGKAIGIYRELGSSEDVATALIGLGRVLSRQGRRAEARNCYEEALQLAQDSGAVENSVLAEASLAVCANRAPESAAHSLASQEAQLSAALHMEARFLVWKSNDDPAQLEQAHRLLCHIRDHAPEEDRERMVDRVPLHHEIVAAWRDHSGTQ